MKSYKDLEIYKLAFDLAIQIHRTSLKLPQYETYELGSQIRRSSKSILFNIVEGYGRKRYKKEFIRFIVFAHASNDEVRCQLAMISEIHSHVPGIPELIEVSNQLGVKIHYFKLYLENNWRS